MFLMLTSVHPSGAVLPCMNGLAVQDHSSSSSQSFPSHEIEAGLCRAVQTLAEPPPTWDATA